MSRANYRRRVVVTPARRLIARRSIKCTLAFGAFTVKWIPSGGEGATVDRRPARPRAVPLKLGVGSVQVYAGNGRHSGAHSLEAERSAMRDYGRVIVTDERPHV